MHLSHIVNKDETPQMPYSDEQIKAFLESLYNGNINDREMPVDLYTAIAKYLKNGVYEGFGGNLSKFANTPDFTLLNELRENIYMFSAAKTFQQVKDISSLLVDGDKVRSREEFLKLGRESFDKWNNDYGKSEYNTAIASASMANKWNDIEKNKDILPNLRYSTIGDACDICAPLDGLTLPVDAPEWNTSFPPNHFNCMCIVTQQDADVAITPDVEKDEIMSKIDPEMSELFKMNVGKDRVIFSSDHPYFDVAPKDREFAADNFGLPIPTPRDEGIKNSITIQKDITQSLIEDNLGVDVKNIVVSSNLNLETITKMNEQLQSLFSEYKVSDVYNNKATPTVKFKSTKTYYGRIVSSNDGTYLEEINFGSESSKARIDDSVILREKSRVDKDKLNISTLTHEFAQLLTVDRQQARYYMDERIKEFMPELRAIKARYLKEIKELYKKSSKIAELEAVYLGKYASTNINEFMAEAFTEYKLCSKPSKYAIEVGKLIDDTFKK